MSLFSRPSALRTYPTNIASPAVLLAGAGAILRQIKHRREAYRLADLPDYLLTDVGLRRDEVHEALSRDWREDPTFRLAVAAAKRRRAQ